TTIPFFIAPPFLAHPRFSASAEPPSYAPSELRRPYTMPTANTSSSPLLASFREEAPNISCYQQGLNPIMRLAPSAGCGDAARVGHRRPIHHDGPACLRRVMGHV